MESRNVTLTLDKAQEFYKSDNAALREIALQAFTEPELKDSDFKSIKNFKSACKTLGITYSDFLDTTKKMRLNLNRCHKASVAALKLNIIRQALNKGQKMKLTEGIIYYPQIRISDNGSTYYDDDLKKGSKVKAGTVKLFNGDLYDILGGSAFKGGIAGLGGFDSSFGVGDSYANVGFLGCASKEIAKHMSRYFAKEIFDAMYRDFINYEWI